MLTRILAAVVAVALVCAYVVPMVVKTRELALGIVIGVGLIVMIADLWHTLRTSPD